MPTYQYACRACGHAFEAVQSFSDDALTECPQCSGALRKVFSSVGVVFKGSGFYKTDSRAAGGAASTASTGSSTSGSSAAGGDDAGSSTPSSGSSDSSSTSSTSSSTPSATTASAATTS